MTTTYKYQPGPLIPWATLLRLQLQPLLRCYTPSHITSVIPSFSATCFTRTVTAVTVTAAVLSQSQHHTHHRRRCTVAVHRYVQPATSPHSCLLTLHQGDPPGTDQTPSYPALSRAGRCNHLGRWSPVSHLATVTPVPDCPGSRAPSVLERPRVMTGRSKNRYEGRTKRNGTRGKMTGERMDGKWPN